MAAVRRPPEDGQSASSRASTCAISAVILAFGAATASMPIRLSRPGGLKPSV